MVGVEVTQDDAITLSLEKKLKIRGVVWWTGRSWRNVYVKDLDRDTIDDGSNCIVFYNVIIREEVVCVKWGKTDRFMYQGQETTPT